MASSQHHPRINTSDLKALIYQKIGAQKGDMYFGHLTRFFSCKMNKKEFSNACVNTIGREYIHLHNRLLRSIISNACLTNVLPPRNVINCLKIRKVRTPINRNGKFRERPSPLGPHVNSPSKFRDRPSPLGPLAKTPSTTISRPVIEEDSGEEEVEQIAAVVAHPITAPLGISMRPLTEGTAYLRICQIRGELPDTKLLMRCLAKKLEEKGVGVSMDSANLLNKGLDVYLKRLIEPMVARGISTKNNGQAVSQPSYVSMVDFVSSVETNPQSLGKDWPRKLEKVSFRHMREIEES